MNQFVVQTDSSFEIVITQQIYNHIPNLQQYFNQVKFTQFQLQYTLRTETHKNQTVNENKEKQNYKNTNLKHLTHFTFDLSQY